MSIEPIRRLAAEAAKQLNELVDGQILLLGRDAPPDRYGRLRAQVFRPNADGTFTWIQGEIVRGGLGRVETQADTRQCAGPLLQIEDQARRKGRGLWRLDMFAIRTVDDVQKRTGSWQIVEGRIREIAQVRGRVYLNFGKDWRKDFTVSIAPKAARLFGDGFFRDKPGKQVRVRGWVERFNGPLIEVTHPEQLEWMADPVAQAVK